jgi:hypothetical protein
LALPSRRGPAPDRRRGSHPDRALDQ